MWSAEKASATTDIKLVERNLRLDRDKIHRIKDGLHAGARDWVGIDPDGNIWTNEGGEATNNGHYEIFLP